MDVLEKINSGIPDGEGLAYAIILLQEAADEIARQRKDIEDLKHDLERHMTALAQAEEYRHKLEPQ